MQEKTLWIFFKRKCVHFRKRIKTTIIQYIIFLPLELQHVMVVLWKAAHASAVRCAPMHMEGHVIRLFWVVGVIRHPSGSFSAAQVVDAQILPGLKNISCDYYRRVSVQGQGQGILYYPL